MTFMAPLTKSHFCGEPANLSNKSCSLKIQTVPGEKKQSVPEQVLNCEPGYADCLYQSQFGILWLQLWHGGQDHPHRRDDHKEDGDVRDHLGRLTRLRFLNQVPQADLVLDKLASTKVLWGLCFENACLGNI